MIFHHIAPSKSFFLTEKNLCFKNFLFKKFFFLIVLAVFSTACSSSSSDSSSSGDSSSNDQKKADSKGSAKVSVKTECELKEKDLVLHQGQTKKFSYSCKIAQDVRGKTLTISHTPNSALELAPTQFAIPDEEKLKGDFKVKGLQVSSTIQASLKVASYSEKFQIAVTSAFVPKASQFTFTQITPTLKKGSTTTAKKFTYAYRKLAVHGDKLYTFQDDKYFVSADGKTWTEKAQIITADSKAVDGQSSYLSFEGKLWGWGFSNNIFSSTNGDRPWNRDPKILSFPHHKGSAVIFQKQAYLLLGNDSNTIHSSSDGINWTKKYTYQQTGSNPDDFSDFDAVVHEDKIWIIGGSHDKAGKAIAFNAVFSYDGSHWKQETNLPETRYRSGTASFAGGLVVLGGGYRDKSNKHTDRTSLLYSPYGSTWYTIIADTAKKSGAGNGIKAVFDMQKWTPKEGDYKDTEALWVINKDGLVYRITYTKK